MSDYIRTKPGIENLTALVDNSSKHLYIYNGEYPHFDILQIPRYLNVEGEADYNAVLGDIVGSIVQLKNRIDDIKTNLDLYKGLVRDVQKSIKDLKAEVEPAKCTCDLSAVNEKIAVLEDNLRSLKASIVDPIYEIVDTD